MRWRTRAHYFAPCQYLVAGVLVMVAACSDGSGQLDSDSQGGESDTGDEPCEDIAMPLSPTDLVAPYEMSAEALAALLDLRPVGEAMWMQPALLEEIPWTGTTVVTLEHRDLQYSVWDYCGSRRLLVDSVLTVTVDDVLLAEKPSRAVGQLRRELETWTELPTFQEAVSLTDEFTALGLKFAVPDDELHTNGLSLSLRYRPKDSTGSFSFRHEEYLRPPVEGEPVTGMVQTFELATLVLTAE